MSKRDYLVNFIGRGGSTRKSAGGGTISLSGSQHSLDGAEHTAATGVDRLLATAAHSGLIPPIPDDDTQALLGDLSWGVIPTTGFELNIEGGQDVLNPLTMGSAVDIDPTDGNVAYGTLTADCTATLLAPTGSGASTIELWVTQDGTGAWDLTIDADGGTVTDDGTITPDTTAGVTVRYILERIPGTTNDWVRDLVGGSGSGVTYGTPALVLGTAAAAGSTDEAIRRDATIVAFDATVPVTQAFSDAAATGSAAVAARRDHVHGMPATPSGDSYFTVDPGTPTYDDSTPGEVDVSVTAKFGIDGSGVPYYNSAGVTSGEEAALMRDPATGTYLLRPYAF